MAAPKGSDDHLARLTRLSGPLLTENVGEALLASAEQIRVDAQASILDGAISGKGHVPSEPGEPPNADTHRLDESGMVTELIEIGIGSVSESVTTSVTFGNEEVPWAVYQELGTSTLPERPYLRPATERGRPMVHENVIAAVNRTSRGV